MVIPVVKTAFVPFSATGGNPANEGAARLCGVSPHPVPDTATALPNHPRSQLRHTRIYLVFVISVSVGYYVVVALLYHISREKEREKSAVFKALLRGS